jgi:hypothetical protein
MVIKSRFIQTYSNKPLYMNVCLKCLFTVLLLPSIEWKVVHHFNIRPMLKK